MTALILKSVLAMLTALMIVVALRRSRASLRHLVLAALFGFLLLLPLVQQFAPDVKIAVGAMPSAIERVAGPVVEPAGSTRPAILPISAHASAQATGASSSPSAIAFRAYAAGALLLLGWLAVGVLRLHRLGETGEVWLEGTATMNEIARDAGIRRPALVILSPGVDVPLTFGFRRSTIVLPVAASTWSAEELARALRHELEHVRREDWMLQLLARAACALYWPNPLAWIAWRRFCLEAERACDDAVVGSDTAPELYAGQLVSLARGIRRMTTVPALGMANRSRLAHRIDAILDRTQRRGPHGRFAAAAVAITLLALLASVAPTRLVSAAAMEAEAGSRDGRDRNRQDRDAREWPNRSHLREAFVKAAEEGDIEVVRRLLEAGIDIDAISEGDGTALIGAARGRQMEMIEFLLERGADVNLASSGDGNPLIAAAYEGQPEIVRLLLDRGARIDDVVPGDENALIQAAGEGQGDVVRLLIERGANVNARVIADRNEIRTPLRMARRGGFTDVEQMLLAAGAVD